MPKQKATATDTKLVDKLTTFVAIAGPLLTAPQVYTIYAEHSAATVSMSTWIGFNIASIIWTWYGYVHRDWLIVTYQGIFVLLQTALIIGGLIYGGHW